MHSVKARRDLERLADEFNLEYVGRTNRGHFRWRHRPTGQIVVTISKTNDPRAIDNTRRSIKRTLSGAIDGHIAAD
jgi:hypothetical protein